MSVSRFILAGVAISATLALWLLLRDPPASPDEAAPAPRAWAAGPASVADPRRVAAVAADPKEVDGDAVEDAFAAADATVAGHWSIEGVVVVQSPDGTAHRELDGELDLEVRPTYEWEPRPVTVSHGRFTAQIPPYARIRAARGRLGGRDAGFQGNAITPSRDGKVEFHGWWIEPVRLHALDAKTLTELQDVSVFARDAGDWYSARPPLDGSAPVVVRDVVSPIVIDHPEPVLWVTAPGYAYARVEIEERFGGDRRVLLVPACQLSVRTFPLPTEPTWLRLSEYDDEGSWSQRYVAPTDPSGLTRIDGLAPGRRRVEVGVGTYPQTQTLGEAEVELMPGESLLEIAMEPLPTLPDALPVRGTLTVAAAWGPMDVTLRLVRADTRGDAEGNTATLSFSPGDTALGDDHRYSFETPPLRPGEYVVRVTGAEYIDRVRVEEDDPRIDLVVPAPCVARVEVRETGGEEVRGVQVFFKASTARLMAGGLPVDMWLRNPYGRARYDAAAGCHVVRGPAGPATLHVFEDAATHERVEIELGERPVAATIVLRRQYRIRVRLLDDGVPLPLDLYDSLVVTRLGEDEDVSDSSSWDGSLVELFVPEPGRYVVHVPRMDGYEPTAPRVADVVNGEAAILDVPLVRR